MVCRASGNCRNNGGMSVSDQVDRDATPPQPGTNGAVLSWIEPLARGVGRHRGGAVGGIR